MERRQTIDNRSDRRMMVFTEPEAQDYWLSPGEQLEIRAPVSRADVVFELSLHEDGIIVWPPHKMGYISAWQSDTELECGHQRPEGWPQNK
jgi:hypothetical protein